MLSRVVIPDGAALHPLGVAVSERQVRAAIVDGGPKLILFVVNGVLCDGGNFRQFGWGRYNSWLRGVAGAETLRIGPTLLLALSDGQATESV